ncbi:MAG: hypothetical protein ACLR0U_18995 [Enterocloster clostridioformis]
MFFTISGGSWQGIPETWWRLTLTSYTQAQKRYLNSSITDAWNTLKGISGTG